MELMLKGRIWIGLWCILLRSRTSFDKERYLERDIWKDLKISNMRNCQEN
jgi:hypothetical protein